MVVATYFNDAARTTVVPNVVTVIQNAIIDTVLLSSPATRPTVAPIINQLPLFGKFGNPQRRFAIHSTSTLTSALDATIADVGTQVVFSLNTAAVWVDIDTFNVMTFDRISITGPVSPINVTNNPGVVGTNAAAVAAAAAAAVSSAAVLSP